MPLLDFVPRNKTQEEKEKPNCSKAIWKTSQGLVNVTEEIKNVTSKIMLIFLVVFLNKDMLVSQNQNSEEENNTFKGGM